MARPPMHGFARGQKTPEYKAWIAMKQRCHDPFAKNFKHYGGRGITVWLEWRESFLAFYRWVGNRPSTRHTLDRIDNDKPYEPGNVQWSLPKAQHRNTRRTRWLTIRGITKSAAEWEEQMKCSRRYLYKRLERGWSPERAVLEPVRRRAEKPR